MALVDMFGKTRSLKKGDKFTVRSYGDERYGGICVEFTTDDSAGLRLVRNGVTSDSKIVFSGVKFSYMLAAQLLELVEVVTNLQGAVAAKDKDCVVFKLV